MIKTRYLVGGAALTVAAMAVFNNKDIEVPLESAHCVTGQPGKYPVKILASDTGAVVHEGGEKRFEIDTQAKTCAYTDKNGDKFVYRMK